MRASRIIRIAKYMIRKSETSDPWASRRASLARIAAPLMLAAALAMLGASGCRKKAPVDPWSENSNGLEVPLSLTGSDGERLGDAPAQSVVAPQIEETFAGLEDIGPPPPGEAEAAPLPDPFPIKIRGPVARPDTPEDGWPIGEDVPAERRALLREPEIRHAALRRIASAGDTSALASVFEVAHFAAMGYAEPLTPIEVEIIQEMTGESFALADWPRWLQWWWTSPEGQSAAKADPGYRAVKRDLYARIDPPTPAQDYARLLDPASPTEIDMTEVFGRPAPHVAFRALTDPTIFDEEKFDYTRIQLMDRVIGVRNGEAGRAYPVRILNHHDVVNDRLGGARIVVSYNPYTWEAFAYRFTDVVSNTNVEDPDEAKATGPAPINFQPSGLLWLGDALMVNLENGSLWSSRRGKPVIGPDVTDPDAPTLWPLPVSTAELNTWEKLFPESTTVVEDPKLGVDYTDPWPHMSFYRSPDLAMPWKRADHRLFAKETVFGITVNGETAVYSSNLTKRSNVIYDRVGGEAVMIYCRHRSLEYTAFRLGGRAIGPRRAAYGFREAQTHSNWDASIWGLAMGSAISSALVLEPIPVRVSTWHAWTESFEASNSSGPDRLVRFSRRLGTPPFSARSMPEFVEKNED